MQTKQKLHVNFKELHKRCVADLADFLPVGKLYNGDRGQHIFKDNGAKILAVCHLDTVQQGTDFTITKHKGDRFISCPRLDDRLGAYILLDLLPKLGLKYDILLSDGEEWGMSTAADFYTEKQYNWMFSFDRTGTQVVMYQYETKALRNAVQNVGCVTGFGSYSDIAELDHLGCAGFNWGTGYYDYHSALAYASERDIVFCVNRFYKFYHKYQNTRFAYARPKTTRKERRAYRLAKRYGSWQDTFDKDLEAYYRQQNLKAYDDGVDNWESHDKFYDRAQQSKFNEDCWFDPYTGEIR